MLSEEALSRISTAHSHTGPHGLYAEHVYGYVDGKKEEKLFQGLYVTDLSIIGFMQPIRLNFLVFTQNLITLRAKTSHRTNNFHFFREN